ncbi:hypothetical protein [Nonomuraea sp. NPDC049028]|uniref:hypothetical protein n=1 Tax=Nonomuraea sp. NPDC049028 TaxID=3364348 RepID=UPI00371B89AE
MRKSAVLFAAVIAAAGLTGAPASATASADVPGLAITQVGYNAYGSDTVWNRNQEFVDVRNTGADAVNVAGLVVADQWAKSHVDDNDRNCNTLKVTSLAGIVTGTDGSVMLPVGHTVRVYSGRGVPAVSAGGSVHALYMNSLCGYHGHIWGNGGDTAWITKGSDSESFAYDFDNGYTVKP